MFQSKQKNLLRIAGLKYKRN
uniref:Uncharacterized protein n=1 Tax=Rhizophora mucronata TaxID=61149 RepID=A0A2P2NTY6_RHIMU